MKCPSCHQEISADSTVCPYCQAKIELPRELKNMGPERLEKRLHWWSTIGQHKHRFFYWGGVLLLVVTVGLGLFYYFNIATADRPPRDFHDHLVTLKAVNDTGNEPSNLLNGGVLAKSGETLYVYENGQVYRCSYALDLKQSLWRGEAGMLNVIRDRIYYVDGKDQTIKCVDLNGKSETNLKIQAAGLLAVGDHLFYTDLDSRAVYMSDLLGEDKRLMAPDGTLCFGVDGDWLYYSNQKGLYKVPLRGGSVMPLAEGSSFAGFVAQDNWVYYQKDGALVRLNLDDQRKTVLVDGAVSSFALSGQDLFYSSTSAGVYRLELDNGHLTQLSTAKAESLEAAGTWIYYRLTSGQDGFFVSVDPNNYLEVPLYAIANK